MEMIGIGKLHLGSDLLQIFCGHSTLDGGSSSYIHKHGRLNYSVNRMEFGTLCTAVFFQ